MIVIVDTGGGNLSSVRLAVERSQKSCTISADPAVIEKASHVILPGVGSAGKVMSRINNLKLTRCLRQLSQPVLGICLGMQILFEFSDEDSCELLGIIPGVVQKLSPSPSHTVPHMGWNQLAFLDDKSPFAKVSDSQLIPYVYFAHSYFVQPQSFTLAVSQHGEAVTALCRHKNFYGMQFHPERSGRCGQFLLGEFLRL